MMGPDQLLDRSEACQALGISRQTLLSWIRKGKLKVWKRVGHGSNAALLFERRHINRLRHINDNVVLNGPLKRLRIGQESVMP